MIDTSDISAEEFAIMAKMLIFNVYVKVKDKDATNNQLSHALKREKELLECPELTISRLMALEKKGIVQKRITKNGAWYEFAWFQTEEADALIRNINDL
jgi:hypothetical protein